jgi:uncharacterized Ntn-hydrolase superfamily protein
MTYSIVARDPETGDLGVAVQSHYFGTGSVVTWAHAGVGAVATQSIPEIAYGPKGLELMRAGVPADEGLAQLVAADPMEMVRQVGFVDPTGRTGTHTGAGCVGKAGHCTGHQVSVQANMMASDSVWPAMLAAYEAASDVDLVERLLRALEAAQAEGGDARGQQSAALLVVSGPASDAPWDQKLFDLRVDDAELPLVELRRLVTTNRAVHRMTEVFDSGVLFAPELTPDSPELASALESLAAAQAGLDPNREPSFWSAALLAKADRLDEARERLAFASETNPGWGQFLQSVAAAGVLPPDNPLVTGA